MLSTTVLLVFWVGLAHTVDDWRPEACPLLWKLATRFLTHFGSGVSYTLSGLNYSSLVHVIRVPREMRNKEGHMSSYDLGAKNVMETRILTCRETCGYNR